MNKKSVLSFVCIVFLLITAVSHTTSSLKAEETPILDKFVYLPIVTKPIPEPIIIQFEPNVSIADPGETIWLNWETEHATAVTLYHLLPTGQFGQFWNVSATGTMSYTISESTRNYERFILYASNEVATANSSIELPLTCPHTWFFAPEPDICPQDAPLISAAAEQRFEHGWMIWVGEEDRIYVLYDDQQFSPKWDSFIDEWHVGLPEGDPNIIPPTGFYQPKRGFGLVWREQPFVRDRLGWALTAQETGYETAVQRTSYAKYNDTFIRAADTQIWKLLTERSGWEKFPNEK